MSTHAHRVSPRSSGNVDDGSLAPPHCLCSPERHSRGGVWGLFTVAHVLLALAGSSTAFGQCHYTYVTIPNPPGWKCAVQAINNRGWATGHLFNAGDNYRAFIWTPESGTSVLPLPPGYTSQRAYDINDHGHVAGSLEGPEIGSAAFFWDGAHTSVISRPNWATHINALGLNHDDHVVGTILNNSIGPIHSFRWANGALEDLGAIGDGENSEARSINDHATIVGIADYKGSPRAYSRSNPLGEIAWLPVPSDAMSSWANDVNDNVFVVGSVVLPADPPGTRIHASGAVWTPNGLTVIPAPTGTTPNVVVRRVNSAGRAVGYYFLGPYEAFVWQEGATTELASMVRPAPPPGLDSAWGVNHSGQIAARYRDGSVVLTPTWLTGDLTGDCQVTIDDLIRVLSEFGAPQGTYPRGDVDFDGDVDLSDLGLLLSNWGA